MNMKTTLKWSRNVCLINFLFIVSYQLRLEYIERIMANKSSS